MIDRVLLIILILLLPVGIFFSRQLFTPGTQGSGVTVTNQSKRVDELIQKLNDRVNQPPAAALSQNLNITGVTFASTSGTLKISGLSPDPKTTILNFVTLESSETIPEIANGSLSVNTGQPVDVRAIKPQPDGTFNFEIPIKKATGIIEVILTQGNTSTVVRYDLASRKQLE